jgi:hypothetical protein
MSDRDRINALLDELKFLQDEIKTLREYSKTLESLLGVQLLDGPDTD